MKIECSRQLCAAQTDRQNETLCSCRKPKTCVPDRRTRRHFNSGTLWAPVGTESFIFSRNQFHTHVWWDHKAVKCFDDPLLMNFHFWISHSSWLTHWMKCWEIPSKRSRWKELIKENILNSYPACDLSRMHVFIRRNRLTKLKYNVLPHWWREILDIFSYSYFLPRKNIVKFLIVMDIFWMSIIWICFCL